MIIVFKFAELFHIAVKFQQGACYQFESVNADEIAEIAAEDTGDGCNAGNFVCFFGRSQNIGIIIMSGGIGKKELSIKEMTKSHVRAFLPGSQI